VDIFEKGTVLFERYEIIKQLGIGGTSIVYLARNNKVGNMVAIKVIDKDNKDFNLLTEKDILIELRHTSIPIIMDIEEDERFLYLVEEYIEGVGLGTYKGTLSEPQVIHIMSQLCDVLVYLHTTFDKPILYLDLKPSNVIQMSSGHIKLIDFGIAKKYKKNSTVDTVNYGTRGYAAPEQYGLARTDVRTDIYSLGVSMYYLITGKNLSTPPYKLKPLREENCEVTKTFEKIIMKCVETVPSKRYQYVDHILKDLESMDEVSESSKDYDTFLKQGGKVITCMGIKRGIGTTHVSILLGMYYQSMGKKVGLIEWQNRESFYKISRMDPEIIEERHFFTFMGIDYYTYYKHKPYQQLMTRHYDVIIVDGGDYEAISLKGHYQQSHGVMMICGTKDWEIDLFEEYYFNRPSLEFHYIFNLADDESYRTIARSMEGFKSYQMPYNPNPYKLEEATKVCFQKLLNDQVQSMNPDCEDRSYDIKSTLINFIKKIQKTEGKG
jgi:serine/threonine-protein kinase